MIEERKEYSKELKRRIPYVAFGVGSGAGMLATHKSRRADKFLKKRVPLKAKYFNRFNKMRKGNVATALVPIAGGTAAFLAGKKATGEKMDTASRASVMSLGGGAAAVALYDKLKKGHMNPLKRNTIGSLGAIAGGLAAVKYLRAKKGRK